MAFPALALAFALALQDPPTAAEPAPPPEAAQDRLPAGAPRDDYQFVAWCYGMLRGYLDLHDQVMPEVTRIESEFRPPDRKLSDDLKVYDEMQKTGKGQLKLFREALTAAEKASLKPINTIGAEAVSKGAGVWQAAPEVTPARLAQEWMSWALPARCEATAKSLKANATLLGGAFKINAEETEAPPPPPPAEAATADAAPAAAAPAPADAAAPAPADGQAPADSAQGATKADPASVMLDPAADPPAPAKTRKKRR